MLKITLDAAYPQIVQEVASTMSTVSGRAAGVLRSRAEHMDTVYAYWRSWPCLFPQHGPGKKHERAIVLADWQREIAARHPGPLARGLIHSDGWRGLNRVRVKGREYAYPRCQFSNRSPDIRAIFCDACDALGVAWRPWGRWHVSVARRDAVEPLDRHVGPKR